ncbi:hypothetical protein [Slackia exigua]
MRSTSSRGYCALKAATSCSVSRVLGCVQMVAATPMRFFARMLSVPVST